MLLGAQSGEAPLEMVRDEFGGRDGCHISLPARDAQGAISLIEPHD